MTQYAGLLCAAFGLGLLGDSVIAQPRPPARAKVETIDSTNSTLLSSQKQALIRSYVGQVERMTKGEVKLTKADESFTVGAPIPSSVELFAMPQDGFGDVPSVTSYRFFLAGNGIVVVNPDTRQVVQVIQAP
jgi:hypothetical protein